jgi:effector-binding domain-containing protein
MTTRKGLCSVFAAAVGSLGLAVLPAVAQQPPKPEPAAETAQLSPGAMKSVRTAVASAKPASLDAVVMQFTGTFDDLPKRFEEFTKEFEAQGLSKRKLPSNPQGIFVVYEDPEGKSSYKLGVGVQMPAKVDAKDPLRVETFQTKAAARVPHTGSYKGLGNVRNAVDKEARSAKGTKAGLERRAGFPVIARLLNDPRKVPDNQRRTELIVPVEQ